MDTDAAGGKVNPGGLLVNRECGKSYNTGAANLILNYPKSAGQTTNEIRL